MCYEILLLAGWKGRLRGARWSSLVVIYQFNLTNNYQYQEVFLCVKK
jgi:hypothetical protein